MFFFLELLFLLVGFKGQPQGTPLCRSHGKTTLIDMCPVVGGASILTKSRCEGKFQRFLQWWKIGSRSLRYRGKPQVAKPSSYHWVATPGACYHVSPTSPLAMVLWRLQVSNQLPRFHEFRAGGGNAEAQNHGARTTDSAGSWVGGSTWLWRSVVRPIWVCLWLEC